MLGVGSMGLPANLEAAIQVLSANRNPELLSSFPMLNQIRTQALPQGQGLGQDLRALIQGQIQNRMAQLPSQGLNQGGNLGAGWGQIQDRIQNRMSQLPAPTQDPIRARMDQFQNRMGQLPFTGQAQGGWPGRAVGRRSNNLFGSIGQMPISY